MAEQEEDFRTIKVNLYAHIDRLTTERDALQVENELLAEVAKQGWRMLDWIAQMPSLGAVTEGCNTEANQVHHSDQPWREKDGETQTHWLNHVGPAIRAAFATETAQQEYPSSPQWKFVSALIAHMTEGRHAFNPNTGKCRCGCDWLCERRD